jgi:hypothetical protein
VSIIGALILPVLVGMAGLVAEYGNGVLARTQDQRVADLAAYAGALAYSSSNSTTTMTSVINNVASLNGIPSADVTGSVVTSPTGDGNQSVEVVVNTTVPLVISRVLNTGTTLAVQGTAYAEMKANSAGCIIALNTAGTGITMTGGTSISAAACAVDSNNSISVHCGDTITTTNVNYDGSAPSDSCTGIQAPAGKTLTEKHTLTADPMAGNSGVSTATARLATVTAMTSPAAPVVTGGTAVAFSSSVAAVQAALTADSCSGTYASSTWTVTCASGGTYHFGAITSSGGITVNFNTGGSAATTYDFSAGINNTGTAMTFGLGTFNVAGGVTSKAGTTTTFGAGTFNIGESASACNGAGKYSVCNLGTMTFGGPSSFTLQGGVYVKGGQTMTFGSGSTNSFNIGASSDGNAYYGNGGAITRFGDATGSGDVFQMVGAVNVSSGGGSCLYLGAAAQHDINGPLETAGGTDLGAGVYTVHGYISLGGNGGGDVTCWGSVVGMNAPGVTLVTDGSSTPASGTCSGQAFCLAAGYSNVTLSAPTTGTTEDLAVIGPISSGNTAGAVFANGAANTSISGVFYMPHGAVTMSGAATLGNGSSACLELIGSQVTLSAGTATGTTCVGAGGSTSASVILVQ